MNHVLVQLATVEAELEDVRASTAAELEKVKAAESASRLTELDELKATHEGAMEYVNADGWAW